jgi:hypothetical protein
MSGLLGRSEILGLLAELGEELARNGTRGELYIVGGSAIALAFDARRATRDIDAVFEPKQAIYVAARQVAARRGLPVGWLNDSVKGLVPPGDDDPQVVMETPGLTVMTASARYLLAMKVAAARVDRDLDDIKLLSRECGLSTAEEILDAAVAVWGPHSPLEPKAQFLIQEAFTAG